MYAKHNLHFFIFGIDYLIYILEVIMLLFYDKFRLESEGKTY